MGEAGAKVGILTSDLDLSYLVDCESVVMGGTVSGGRTTRWPCSRWQGASHATLIGSGET